MVLRHDHTARAFDLGHPERAVAAGAGEHDADRVLALAVRERPKEVVERHDRRPVGHFDMEARLVSRQHATGRGHVHAVGRESHAVDGGLDLDLRVASQQIGQQRHAARRLVRDDHERHAGVRRNIGENSSSSAAKPPADAPMPTIGKRAGWVARRGTRHRRSCWAAT